MERVIKQKISDLKKVKHKGLDESEYTVGELWDEMISAKEKMLWTKLELVRVKKGVER